MAFIRYKQLKKKNHGFPRGRLIGGNVRVFDEETEIESWLKSRPTAPKPTPRGKWKRGRPKKATAPAGAEA